MTEHIQTPDIRWSPSAEHIGIPNARVAFIPSVVRQQGKVVSPQEGFVLTDLRPVYVIDNPEPWEKGQGRYPNGTRIDIDGVPAAGLSQADMHAAAFELARRNTPIPVDEQFIVPVNRLQRPGHPELMVPPNYLGPLRGQRLAEIALSYKQHRAQVAAQREAASVASN